MTEKKFDIEIQSEPNSLPEVEEFIEKISDEIDLTKAQLTNLMISVNEATTNGMLHGNKSDEKKKIKITILADDAEVKAIIKDEGKGFDPSKIPDPTDADNIFKESGRGLYIMRTCMNEVNYKFFPDGTELTLVLKRRKV